MGAKMHPFAPTSQRIYSSMTDTVYSEKFARPKISQVTPELQFNFANCTKFTSNYIETYRDTIRNFEP